MLDCVDNVRLTSTASSVDHEEEEEADELEAKEEVDEKEELRDSTGECVS